MYSAVRVISITSIFIDLLLGLLISSLHERDVFWVHFSKVYSLAPLFDTYETSSYLLLHTMCADDGKEN